MTWSENAKFVKYEPSLKKVSCSIFTDELLETLFTRIQKLMTRMHITDVSCLCVPTVKLLSFIYSPNGLAVLVAALCVCTSEHVIIRRCIFAGCFF